MSINISTEGNLSPFVPPNFVPQYLTGAVSQERGFLFDHVDYALLGNALFEATVLYPNRHLIHCNGLRRTSDGLYYFAYERLLGAQKLPDLLSLRGGLQSLDRKEVFDIIASMIYPVKHMHEHGILHRDIKPYNYWIYQGIVVLGDFKCAIYLGYPKGANRLGTSLYRLAYTYDKAYDERPIVDICSLAISIVEIIAKSDESIDEPVGCYPGVVTMTMSENSIEYRIVQKYACAFTDYFGEYGPTMLKVIENALACKYSSVSEFERDFLSLLSIWCENSPVM